MAQMKHYTEKKIIDLENRLVVALGKGKGVGWTGSLVLIDANKSQKNRIAMRYCCVALGTLSGHLCWSMIM